MGVKEQINELSSVEKIQIMEHLWDQLKQPEDEFTPPQWHSEVLEVREGNQSF